ncbi:NADH-quinone oxidoreductase subunit J [Candidatus Aalborgicola defluviihabitans]|uniref:NADH-quinone oxidoreductase subunit J n=1 Tax=Candidatus Aalborgicola defluviihabitans TaxID=3386187 RepID=UPI001DCDC5AF|nr:NADH-quinone oxidoreductase subunit J [Burkholderiales bacterium]MBK6568373.1 NADH-quinone oxidoreductase subunit J [Burkholderiales bacterium]MBK7280347.1 NADH-quinone oxidoreductase subunit J [Burkholderiales bacterium]MBK7313511.1 NADH-quinone oxidoreductase subunit J [Burkholderiales bacterium]MBL0244349.1 NADH-quinone oxidoreductase subunit J [Rhodoferax sp.]
MSVTTGLFYLFSTIMLVAAFRVITARNPVHAVLFLVLTFFQASMIWMLLKAEFLSLILILVYVGAVMVLFLFVVMMVDVKTEELRVGFWKHFPVAALVGVLIALEMATVLMGGFRVTEGPNEVIAMVPGAPRVSDAKELGKLLYTQYLYPLEVAAAILLVAMIAAIALTLRSRKDTRYVNPYDQVRVKARDRLQVLKMVSTKAPPVSAPAVSSEGEQK